MPECIFGERQLGICTSTLSHSSSHIPSMYYLLAVLGDMIFWAMQAKELSTIKKNQKQDFTLCMAQYLAGLTLLEPPKCC